MSNLSQHEPRHLFFLDVLRGVAVLMVFFYHLLIPSFGIDKLPWKGLFRDFQAVGWDFLALYPFTYGSAGVAVFFVVSGFCIHLSHAAKANSSWLDFGIRRFFRIMPPYWVALLVFFFLLPLDSSLIRSIAGYETLTAHLLALHNLREWWLFGINPSFWTIAVEVQLYAIYPLLLWVVAKKGWAFALGVTAIVELALRAASSYLGLTGSGALPVFIGYSPFYFWFSWSLGAVLAEAYRRGCLPMLSSRFLWMALLAAFAAPLCIATDPFKFPLFAIATALVILRCLQPKAGKARSAGKLAQVLASVGVVSYSFYLYHQPLLIHGGAVLERLFPAGVDLLTFFSLLLLIVPVYGVSKLSFKFVEKTSNAVGKRWVSAR